MDQTARGLVGSPYNTRSEVATIRTGVASRLKLFFTPFDARFEEFTRENWYKIMVRDTSAGLIVAMMAIPMAMGFAMASGLRPEHGILAGAIAGLVGALFSGSKYNVYGPVAALIPVIATIMSKYATPDDPFAGHGFLVAICVTSGPILMLLGLIGWGKVGNMVPHSIVVGFSVGIAITIALTQAGEVLGLSVDVKGTTWEKVRIIAANLSQTNWAAILVGAITFLMTRYLLRISIFVPAPLLALGVCSVLAATVLSESGLKLIKSKYGEIPTNFFLITPPALPAWDLAVFTDLIFYAVAFAFVCGFESILAARLADRLADNRGTQYNPDKEFFGQGLIQSLVPILNGMPLSGALARTATNIKVGAVTPLAGIMKCVQKLILAYFLAHYLELVPMACIGGILLWVSFNMVKPTEIRDVLNHNRFHAFLMVYTAVAVIATDFLKGVLSALVIYAILFRFFDKPTVNQSSGKDEATAPPSALDDQSDLPANGHIAARVGT